MTLTDSNLRYLLAIHHLAQQSTEVSPLALAQAMGVTKPSVTSILTSLMKQGVIVRRRYGKIYITDRGVLYARYYDELVEKILQHFPLAGEGFTPRGMLQRRGGHGRVAARKGDRREVRSAVRQREQVNRQDAM